MLFQNKIVFTSRCFLLSPLLTVVMTYRYLPLDRCLIYLMVFMSRRLQLMVWLMQLVLAGIKVTVVLIPDGEQASSANNANIANTADETRVKEVQVLKNRLTFDFSIFEQSVLLQIVSISIYQCSLLTFNLIIRRRVLYLCKLKNINRLLSFFVA